MYADEYGKKHFKHKTNFNDLVVFSDVLQNKIEGTDASFNTYVEVEKGVKTSNKWFVHINNRLPGEYGDFFIDNDPPFGEINIEEAEKTDDSFTFMQKYSADITNGSIDYYLINEKFYIRLDGAYDLDEVIIYGKGVPKSIKTHSIELNAFVTLFTSEDGAQLELAYQTIKKNVNAHEVIIFIETSGGSNAFGTVFRVLKGENVNTLPEVDRLKVTEIARAYGVKIVTNELSKMIKEELQNDSSYFYLILNKTVGNAGRVLRWGTDEVLTATVDGLKFVSKEIEGLKLGDNRWKTIVDGKENPKFNPLLPKLNTENTFAIEQLTNSIYKDYLDPLVTKTIGSVKEIEKSKFISKLIPFDVSIITKTLESIPTLLKEFFETVESQLSQLYNFINGLLVGLINSIIEFVKSIFDILALLFSILNGAIQSTKFFENPESYLGLFAESFENLIDAIGNAFTFNNIKKFFGFIANLPKQAYTAIVNLINNISEIDIDIDPGAIGYYLGFIVGFIASEVVVFFATGGVGTIAKATQTVLRSYKELLKITVKATKNVVSFGLDTLVKLIKNIVAFSKNIPKYLDDLSGLIDNFIASLQARAILINNVVFSVIDPVTAFASTVFNIFKANSWKKLNSLGVSILKNEGEIYTFLHNGQNLAQDLSKSQAEEFLKEIFSEIKGKSDDAVKKYLDDVLNDVNAIANRYKKLYTRPDGLFDKLKLSDVRKKFGSEGVKLVNSVESKLKNLRSTLVSGNNKREHVLVSGIIDKKTGKASELFTNFTKKELKNGTYENFITKLHPNLRDRLKIHLEKRSGNGTGLNLKNPDDLKFAGEFPAAHAEIRAMDDLLKKISLKKLDEDIFKNFLGYNSNLKKDGIMARCADCFYLSDLITFIK